MVWTYQGKEIHSHEDLYPECTDFVYELTYTDGTKYIGKKTVRSIRRIKPTKAQLAIRKNYVRKELKDSPFIKYEGSSTENEGKTLLSKEILYQSSNKKTASYIEASLLFYNDVLFTDKYNNKNISGTYFDNSLDGLLGEDND
jgi:transposase